MNELLTNEQLEAMDVDSFLNASMDSIADLEGFKLKPTGLYSFVVKNADVTEMGMENKPVIAVELELTSCLELVNEAESEEVGELPCKYTENYFLTGKMIGGKAFATFTRELAQANGWATIAEVVTGMQGFSGSALIQKRKWKDKETGELKEGNQLDVTTASWE